MTLRDQLTRSLDDASREVCACLGHDVILPATRLIEHGGRLQAAAMTGDFRFVPDSLSEIDKAIRELVQYRMNFARRTEGVVAVLPVVEG